MKGECRTNLIKNLKTCVILQINLLRLAHSSLASYSTKSDYQRINMKQDKKTKKKKHTK